MNHTYHILDDEEAGANRSPGERRVLFLCTCPICKEEFEVRDGEWLPMFSRKGTEVRIKVCNRCHLDETT